MGEDEELMTEQEVADLLRISLTAVKRLRFSGKGPRYVRISQRVVRYPRKGVLDWMERGGAEEP
jgi:predicted DNA-binding transcriptional regulator AlpA